MKFALSMWVESGFGGKAAEPMVTQAANDLEKALAHVRHSEYESRWVRVFFQGGATELVAHEPRVTLRKKKKKAELVISVDLERKVLRQGPLMATKIFKQRVCGVCYPVFEPLDWDQICQWAIT